MSLRVTRANMGGSLDPPWVTGYARRAGVSPHRGSSEHRDLLAHCGPALLHKERVLLLCDPTSIPVLASYVGEYR